MTSLTPREPYSPEELDRLYPKGLQLQLVQVFLRHGERTPVSARFQNTGLPPYWPYCKVAGRMAQMAASKHDLGEWDSFQWRRKMETFGPNDAAVPATGPRGETEGICQHGELTDRGRETTFALGQRLRHLYVDQLGFLPGVISDAEDMYLRSTPVPRALESLHQTFWGMYPASARTVDFLPPTIVARSISDETLFPNEGGCRRFRQLARLFADRAADRWNNTEEMNYVNHLWSKYMPTTAPRIAVDGKPRLSGIMDTINATDAHGPDTKLPAVFYDKRARDIVDRIAVDEWYSGYGDSVEFRKLGIGSLMGDVVDNMVSVAVNGSWRSASSVPRDGDSNREHGESRAVRFGLSGCHDTTIVGILASVGAFEDGKWPRFTSSVAVELFSDSDSDSNSNSNNEPKSGDKRDPSGSGSGSDSPKGGGNITNSILSYLPGFSSSSSPSTKNQPLQTARVPLTSLPDSAREKLRTNYVRIRYNDRPVRIPGCAAKPENHLPGDETFCTLDAFKAIVDKFTPRCWRDECGQNVGEGLFGRDGRFREDAGF